MHTMPGYASRYPYIIYYCVHRINMFKSEFSGYVPKFIILSPACPTHGFARNLETKYFSICLLFYLPLRLCLYIRHIIPYNSTLFSSFVKVSRNFTSFFILFYFYVCPCAGSFVQRKGIFILFILFFVFFFAVEKVIGI